MTGQAFETCVFSYMEQQGMIERGDTVCAAVSGGADSVCLLLLLNAYRARKDFTLKTVHVEHGIRGKESLADARFVETLCRKMDIPVRTLPVDAAGFAGQEGLSLEEAARILRYRAFEEAIGPETEEKGAGRVKIALAHHREDQAETVLFNLVRGSGLRGLGGMQPVRGIYLRPLLESGRGDIERYLTEKGQDWREDATNSDTNYTRNLIRHRILPALSEGVNEQAVQHICEAAKRARGAADYLDRQAEDFARAHMRAEAEGVVLDIAPLRTCEGIVREHVLRMAVGTARAGAGLKDIGAVHIADLDELVFKPRGKHLDLPGRLKAERRGQSMVLWVERQKICQ